MKNLYLLRGIPGAGKSTLAKQLGDAHFEADSYFMIDGEYQFDPTKLRKAHEWCQGQVELAMIQNHITYGLDSSDIVQAQLLFLDSVEKKDITLYINSPGGSVMCGLGIVDLMNYVSSDIVTTNLGMCASMGSVLLSSGTKGKRSSLIHSKVMTHQVSHGTRGNIQDTRIDQMEGEKYNYILFKILAENCGKTFQEL